MEEPRKPVYGCADGGVWFEDVHYDSAAEAWFMYEAAVQEFEFFEAQIRLDKMQRDPKVVLHKMMEVARGLEMLWAVEWDSPEEAEEILARIQDRLADKARWVCDALTPKP